MAVSVVNTITLDEFLDEVGYTDLANDSVDRTRLERIFHAVCQLVADKTVEDTPISLKNQSIILLGAYINDRPRSSKFSFYSNALQFSGAGHLLADYMVRPSAFLKSVDEEET